jgi:medium-chain acyl-[acyl-carrier-protein] hydrolase
MEIQHVDLSVWSDEYVVRSHDVDVNNRMKLSFLLFYLLESASNHSSSCGCGFHELMAKNQYWNLSGLKLIIERMPTWDEKIRVNTWIKGIENNDVVRDFQIYGNDNRLCAKATSNWVIHDGMTKKPVALMDTEFDNCSYLNPEHAIKGKIDKLGPVTKIEESEIRYVYFSDLDMNGVVNHGKYLQWLKDTYDGTFHKNHQVKAVDVNFMTSCHLDHRVEIKTESIGECVCYLHSIFNARTGMEAVRAKFTWM